MMPRVTRRSFLGASVLVGTGAHRLEGEAMGFVPMVMQEVSTPVEEANTPSWRFIVYTFEDPYRGTVLQPESPKDGTRYVGAEVSIRNESDAALNFSPSAIRLRDTNGVEYPSGGVIGSDPRILDINLIPGERASGWVWFSVPEDAELVELTYVAPSPRLTVPLSADPELDSEGTPIPSG